MRKENTCTVLIRLFLYFLMLILSPLILIWWLVELQLNGGIVFIALVLMSRFILLGIDKILSIINKKD